MEKFKDVMTYGIIGSFFATKAEKKAYTIGVYQGIIMVGIYWWINRETNRVIGNSMK